MQTFQFHSGTIKSLQDSQFPAIRYVFQFHSGTIKRWLGLTGAKWL